MRKQDSNVEFVNAMGSPSGTEEGPQPKGLYGPLPEDDWLYRMRYADADESAMGWLHAHTIDLNHHSLYARDEHGKAVGAKHLAAYKGWDVDFAEKVLLRLEKAGRIRRDVAWDKPTTGKKGRGKVWICGYVPAAHEEHEPGKKPRPKGVCTNPLHNKLYVKKQLEALKPEVRKALLSWDKEFEKIRPKAFAGAAADTRGMLDEIQYRGYEAHGVKLKRLKKRAKPSGLLKVTLLNLPDSVQTPLPPEFVQTVKQGLYEPKMPFVQTDQSGSVLVDNSTESQHVAANGTPRAFLDSDKDKTLHRRRRSSIDTNTPTTTFPSPTSPNEIQQVGEALRNYCTPDEEGVCAIIERCRKKVADATLEEILFAVHSKGKTAGKDKAFAYFVFYVPKFFEGESFGKFRRPVEPRRSQPVDDPAEVETWEQYRDAEVKRLLKEMGEEGYLLALAEHAVAIKEQYPRLPKDELHSTASRAVTVDLQQRVMPFAEWRKQQEKAAGGGAD